ncbi:MAG: hypothetical protein FJY29_03830 [Betaproteobacteria bacterium]|nr:hypothetical protein [Betaproteobacteria bacterium]
MLRVTGIIGITFKENFRGQILWTSAISGLVLLILVSILSGTALTHENRILDVFSYFATDLLLLLVAIFSGASICTTDFSARGIAELYVPAGVKRHSILFARVAAHATILFLLAACLYLFKTSVLPLLTDFPRPPDVRIHLVMFLFSFLKSCTALCIATFLGSLARPLYAVLGTLTLFSIGHLTSTLDSLLVSTTQEQAQQSLGLVSSLFYSTLKVWNPNLLLVESLRGEWLMPTSAGIGSAFLWATGFALGSLGLALGRISRLDIRG